MYDRRTFALRTIASLLATGALVLALVMSGTAYAVPLGGIGGFDIQAEEITAESAVFYPGYGQTSTEEKANLLIVELRDVELTGLTLRKPLDTSTVPGISGDAELAIDSGTTVSADQLILKTSGVQGEQATLNNAIIAEQSSSDPSDSFLVSAGDASGSVDGQITSIDNDRPAAKLTDVTLTGHYVAAGALTIPDLEVRVQSTNSTA